ncbi:MAG: sugar transferase [Phycisphaerae bacterium]|jgi:lipopolysaccharide/colanic/teichoic acid biosynthesis glycosyltransferase
MSATLTPSSPAPSVPHRTATAPTVWGMDWMELHARYWAARGVQLVRVGERTPLVAHAELFMLLDKHTLSLFRLAPILDDVSWVKPDLIIVRVSDAAKQPYSERLVADETGKFMRLQRIYDATQVRIGRVVLTSDKDLAGVWQQAADASSGWEQLRKLTRRTDRYPAKLRGKLFDANNPDDLARFGHELIQRWPRPDATISRISEVSPGIWADKDAKVDVGPGVRGPLWVGAGREITKNMTAVGPAVLWDRPEQAPPKEQIEWLDLENLSSPAPKSLLETRGAGKWAHSPLKRLFDIAAATAGILGTFPIYPLVALAILIEDGRPIFFAHKRETLGGRQFGCLKFRSMRKDSEEIKARLMAQNQADGPQFFMKNDPRLTKVGAFIREYQIDELPQLFNILKGDMSVVGPRPSPFKENQYCPPWREARLSVRPGLTGLWQISRTREEGNDFQEWIKYDIRYVEKQSLWLDLWIIWRTLVLLVKRATKS